VTPRQKTGQREKGEAWREERTFAHRFSPIFSRYAELNKRLKERVLPRQTTCSVGYRNFTN